MKSVIVLFSLSVLSGLVFFAKNVRAETLSNLQKEGILRVCTTAGYAPFEVKSRTGKWVGFDVRMFEAFAATLGVRLELLDLRWEGVFPALISGKCDFAAGGISVTETRKKVMLFSDPVYRSGNSLVISLAEKEKYKTLAQLDSKNIKIAVKTGNTADLYLSGVLKQAKLLKFDTNADMLTAVLEGRANAFAQDFVYAQMAIAEHPKSLFLLPGRLNEEDLAVVTRKQETALVQSFNKFLKNWKKEGGYDQAVDYYILTTRWKKELEN